MFRTRLFLLAPILLLSTILVGCDSDEPLETFPPLTSLPPVEAPESQASPASYISWDDAQFSDWEWSTVQLEDLPLDTFRPIRWHDPSGAIRDGVVSHVALGTGVDGTVPDAIQILWLDDVFSQGQLTSLESLGIPPADGVYTEYALGNIDYENVVSPRIVPESALSICFGNDQTSPYALQDERVELPLCIDNGDRFQLYHVQDGIEYRSGEIVKVQSDTVVVAWDDGVTEEIPYHKLGLEPRDNGDWPPFWPVIQESSDGSP